jgi:glycosyltransferase involved in cell wall biosynthesis
LGNLEWRPNLDAVRLLLDEVFPKVVAAEPSARLCIVGRRPPAWLQRRASESARIEVHPDVDDVRPFLYRCGAMAVPLRIGGGSRLKILEALACGMPVVASSIGAEGLRLKAGEHFACASETLEMARVLIEWMRNPAPALVMAEAGRAVVESCYDWSALADKMESAWEELTECSRQASHSQVA